ncbi:MAG TPA: hypothetical protein VMB34_01100 [Acetobacteraceae bacterium]|nr:hypothetical protein [Acetobacteraceae bacterium]
MIGHVSALIGYTSPDAVVPIRAMALPADGTRCQRRAVLRPAGEQKRGEVSWQILAWD